ncbi:hypothetical protein KR032_011505 [Drosophila birchii]|nr:hypothetical protein KR032_011505 [Drosophila birchii]
MWASVGLTVLFLARGLAAADRSCPAGFYLSTTNDSCVSLNIVDCQRLQISQCPAGTTSSTSQFCRCQQDLHLEILDCPEGTYFDASYLICRIGTVECQEQYTPFACPSAASSSIFCLCVGGTLQIQNCPAGAIFNTEQNMCLKISSGSDSPSSGDSSNESCQRFGLFGDPTDCSGYFHCADKGEEIKHSRCQAGMIFSLTMFGCVPGAC